MCSAKCWRDGGESPTTTESELPGARTWTRDPSVPRLKGGPKSLSHPLSAAAVSSSGPMAAASRRGGAYLQPASSWTPSRWKKADTGRYPPPVLPRGICCRVDPCAMVAISVSAARSTRSSVSTRPKSPEWTKLGTCRCCMPSPSGLRSSQASGVSLHGCVTARKRSSWYVGCARRG